MSGAQSRWGQIPDPNRSVHLNDCAYQTIYIRIIISSHSSTPIHPNLSLTLNDSAVHNISSLIPIAHPVSTIWPLGPTGVALWSLGVVAICRVPGVVLSCLPHCLLLIRLVPLGDCQPRRMVVLLSFVGDFTPGGFGESGFSVDGTVRMMG